MTVSLLLNPARPSEDSKTPPLALFRITQLPQLPLLPQVRSPQQSPQQLTQSPLVQSPLTASIVDTLRNIEAMHAALQQRLSEVSPHSLAGLDRCLQGHLSLVQGQLNLLDSAKAAATAAAATAAASAAASAASATPASGTPAFFPALRLPEGLPFPPSRAWMLPQPALSADPVSRLLTSLEASERRRLAHILHIVPPHIARFPHQAAYIHSRIAEHADLVELHNTELIPKLNHELERLRVQYGLPVTTAASPEGLPGVAPAEALGEAPLELLIARLTTSHDGVVAALNDAVKLFELLTRLGFQFAKDKAMETVRSYSHMIDQYCFQTDISIGNIIADASIPESTQVFRLLSLPEDAPTAPVSRPQSLRPAPSSRSRPSVSTAAKQATVNASRKSLVPKQLVSKAPVVQASKTGGGRVSGTTQQAQQKPRWK